jgi:hypothetical protein
LACEQAEHHQDKQRHASDPPLPKASRGSLLSPMIVG